jgi:hypothetical protein
MLFLQKFDPASAVALLHNPIFGESAEKVISIKTAKNNYQAQKPFRKMAAEATRILRLVQS